MRRASVSSLSLRIRGNRGMKRTASILVVLQAEEDVLPGDGCNRRTCDERLFHSGCLQQGLPDRVNS